MAFNDSMFLFEIKVEELTSFISCKEFLIKGQFADVFSVDLKDPNAERLMLARPGNQRGKRKSKRKYSKGTDSCSTRCSAHTASSAVQTGQSILFAINVDTLILNMREYPLELSLWSKAVPDYKVGSTHIPWSAQYYEYLNKLHKKPHQQPICLSSTHNVFDEITSKRMAVIKLNLKLSHFKEEISPQMRSQQKQATAITAYNAKPVLHTIKCKAIKLHEDTGIIKTIYSDNKSKQKVKNNIEKRETSNDSVGNKERITEVERVNPLNRGFTTLARSSIHLTNNPTLTIIKSKSCSSIDQGNAKLLRNYIFGNKQGPIGNQVYCVGYFTVDKNPSPEKSIKSASDNTGKSPSEKSGKSASDMSGKSASDRSGKSASDKSGKTSPDKSKSSKPDEEPDNEKYYKFRICESECLNKRPRDVRGRQSTCSLDLPRKASHLIKVRRCDDVNCTNDKVRKLPTPPDDRILLDLTSRRPDCCNVTQKVEEVVGAVKAMMKFGADPCYCECECEFNFTKKTTFCTICGGYEHFGEEYSKVPGYELPFPCPIYHKLDKKATKSSKGSESEKDEGKKGKKKKKDDRFKFNYGYTAPHIGHSQCAMPCVGTLGAVPKHMGWLWTCENVPGMKYRGPQWRPGATNKHVVRLLKYAKNPDDFLAKKRKKDKDGKVKRPLKRPLLTVHKKDGEYTVTMETMKTFTRQRTYNQYPYEDKPVVTYTIGRTSEENLQRKIKKERAQRRLERLQRDFVQSAFRDMCQDICLKTYQQALQMLPDAELPDCSCVPAQPGPDKVDPDHSCSCSEDKDLSETDTDSDEWLVEFTPPTAKFDSTYKSKKVALVDNSSQYSYLDYRVKLLDRFGNPVPRFFKGPDGTEQCSDLGGFWDPDHRWQEINVDGFIGPDEKWAPNNFIGPNGESVDAEAGKFQAMNGDWLVVGVDGYVINGKWKFYSKSKKPDSRKNRSAWKNGPRDTKEGKPSVGTWSCFGTATSPKLLSKMGIVGHGYDKKLLNSTLKEMRAQGENVKIPEPSTVPRSNMPKKKRADLFYELNEHKKCKHATPSDKGIVAVDGRGNKTFFKLKDYHNRRPKDRMTLLTDQGISVSSFHMPCFHSFISNEVMKKQQYDRLVAMAERRQQAGGEGGHRSTRTTTDRTTTATDYTGAYHM